MIGAIAAGNCAIIKPSELVPSVERVFLKLMNYLDTSCYRVVCGDVPITQQLLNYKWDKIFFTGSPRVGKIVLQAAAQHLTPVTLELGGKSPTIIDESVQDMDLIAQRIMWGKCVNAGQTCIAPDYVLVHERQFYLFLESAKKAIAKMYGSNIQQSADYARIVNKTHFLRLKVSLLKSYIFLSVLIESMEIEYYC